MGELHGLHDFLFSQCKKSRQMPTENRESPLTKPPSRAIGKSVQVWHGNETGPLDLIHRI
jgi:hypothetical protein